MRLDGRRESSNVEDRRGLSGGAKAGIGGIGGIILIALFTFLQGGDVTDVVNNVVQQTMQAPTETVGEENFTEEEQELASDCKKILASTEEVWTKVFQDNGWGEYQYPTLVLFTNQVNSACGSATAAVGPFYCSGDQKLYVDLSFFTQMMANRTIKVHECTQEWIRFSLSFPASLCLTLHSLLPRAGGRWRFPSLGGF